MTEELKVDADFCEQVMGIPIIRELGDPPSVTVPIAGKLQSYTDFTIATPSDCSLSFNLLVQLTPLLANLKCVANILGVIVALKKFATNPLSKGPDLIKAIDDAQECLTPFLIPQVCLVLTIYDTLQLILKLLGCLIEQLDSLVTFQAKFDWDAAQNDPVFAASLACAQKNIDNSMKNLKKSLEPINVTAKILNSLSELSSVNIPLNLEIDIEDPTGTLKKLKSAYVALEEFTKTLETKADLAKELCTPNGGC